MYTKSRHRGASDRIARRRRAKQSATLFLKSAVLLFILVGAGFLLRADFLKVREFKIEGALSTPVTDLQNTAAALASGTRLGLLPKSNILIFDGENLTRTILEKFTRLEKVEVDKNIFSRKVAVKVVERGAAYLWCSENEECFFMSRDGLIFEKVSPEKSAEAAGKIIFKGKLAGAPLLEHFETRERMKNYTNLFEVLSKNQINITAVNFELADKAVAATNLGSIIFNPEEKDLSEAALNIVLLIEDLKTRNPTPHFEYIDARFGNKMFYKVQI